MRHPFDLDRSELAAIDLNFEETLTDEEAQQVEGGWGIFPHKPPHYLGPPIKRPPSGIIKPPPHPYYPIKPPIHPSPQPPMVTTLALGEEGGSSMWID